MRRVENFLRRPLHPLRDWEQVSRHSDTAGEWQMKNADSATPAGWYPDPTGQPGQK